MQSLVEFDVASWQAPVSDEDRHRAVDGLEAGGVLYFPRLAFELEPAEHALVERAQAPSARKNITFDPRTGRAHGSELDEADGRVIAQLLDRYGAAVEAWFDGLFPAYAGGVERARATFRPAEIAGREYSPRKDDRRLHVDAFPSRPTGGRRILRIFTNINPFGEARVWEVGEPFADFAARFWPRTRGQWPLEKQFLALTGITKSPRGAYDHAMLELHDRCKLDQSYQESSPHQRVAFPSGSTWLCFTDQVLHAALSGRGVLEQTLLVDPTRLVAPDRAPKRVLERLANRALA